MLDVKRVRENFEEVKAAVERRGQGDFGIDNIIKYDKERRELLAEVETMKNRQSVAGKDIPKMKKLYDAWLDRLKADTYIKIY